MFWLSMALGADCAAPTEVDALMAGLERAEQSLADLDPGGMQQEVVSLSAEVLPCLGTELAPEVAARFHRLMSVHLFILGQEDGALQAARASKQLDAAYVWDDTILPESHPIRTAWDSLADPGTKKVPEPRDGFLMFDGVSGRSRPKGVPTISQGLDASGRPTWTAYLGPREPLPAYNAVPRRRNMLIGCAVAGGAIGVGGWAASMASKANLASSARDPSLDAKVLDGKRTRSNALQTLGFVGIGVGIGCGIGAVLEAL